MTRELGIFTKLNHLDFNDSTVSIVIVCTCSSIRDIYRKPKKLEQLKLGFSELGHSSVLYTSWQFMINVKIKSK